MLLAGFDAASKEDDAARLALQHRLDRADALAAAAAEAAERADAAAAAAAAASSAAEQRALRAEAACAHVQAEASRAAEAEDALRECAAELDAVRAQLDGQAEERLSLQEELRATQDAVRAEADAAGQLRGEVEPLRHKRRFRRVGGWVGGAERSMQCCASLRSRALSSVRRFSAYELEKSGRCLVGANPVHVCQYHPCLCSWRARRTRWGTSRTR
jgi:hypothetical protein